MRAILIALVLSMTVLAGCADDGPATSDDDADKFDDFDADVAKGKGLIRGIVVDATITPIEGATISIKGTETSVESNEEGAFQIVDLEPGSYFLEVSKPGYSTIQSSAEVVADDAAPPIARIQLDALAGSAPTALPYVLDGFLGCSARYFIEGRTCPGATSIWPEHEFIQDIELSQIPTYVTSEMVWESTQALGGEMSFNLRRTDTNRDTIDIEGRSPLFLALNETTIALHGDGLQGGFGPEMPVRVIVFTAHLEETEPPVGGLWGVGVQLEQPYTVYSHIFYNYEPPEDWRFTDDPEVPQPQ